MLHVRGAEARDANQIIDIDIKCFEEAWSTDQWTAVGRSGIHAISVATSFGTPVGFGVFLYDREARAIQVVKLAVKAQFRRQNISMQLLMAALDYANAKDATFLYIIIPESAVYPGPKNVSDWLKAVGFEAKNFIKNHFHAYGETEDGVRFVAPVRK